MDLVQILLLALVGLSALVFLILDTLDSHQSSKQSGSDLVIARRGEVESVGAGEKRLESEGNRINDDWDWEGVERSELEKIFGEAMVYVESCQSIGEDVKLQLYGLQKAALQGPCYGSRPTALHLSARSKWNAWKKVGSISEEIAMEKYIATLSEAIPDWKKGERDEAVS
ncbi:acyl-CoA-binding domain-containing protein 3-like isoform X2 [Salvia hispanica]|uniref:acyl-CoA-binding domain-containing protein 3-like isoform X2 n=1 Tax=Salvia hispanica TaxID=49212 RepID=UPI0020099C9A|nr:acyl-CoA-binding domain-containing protein 3-like isoform X2 [Salvia hispanica]